MARTGRCGTLDTGIRTKELLHLHNSVFAAKAGCVAVSMLVLVQEKVYGRDIRGLSPSRGAGQYYFVFQIQLCKI